MRWISSLKVLTAGVALTCLTSACQSAGGAQAPGGGDTSQLRWGLVADNLPSIDPLTLTSGSALLSTVYDALLTAGPDGQLAPGLAESWDNPDPMTYVFHLRQGVTFWDGTELTAADVVASLDYERLAPSPYESLFVNVASVTADDAGTVRIQLKQADAGLLSLLASVGASIFQKKFYDEHREDFGKPGTLVMATGPYKITRLDPTRGAEFTANPNWWGGKPAVSTVEVLPFKNQNSAALAYRSKQLDAVYPLSDPNSFKASSGASLTSVAGCKQTFMSLNTQAAPWNDVHVRRAFAYALNREDLAKAEGEGNVAYDSFFPADVLEKVANPAQIDSLITSLPTHEHDVSAAKAELAQSAYPSGVSGTFEVPDDGTRPDIAQAIASMVAQAGIKLDVKVLSQDQYTQRIGESAAADKIQLTIQRLDCSEEPQTTAGALLDSASADVPYANYAAYSNPAADALLKSGISTNDRAQRFAAYSGLDKLVADDVPYIPLYLGENTLALSDKFSWPGLNPFSSVYGPAAWVAQVKAS